MRKWSFLLLLAVSTTLSAQTMIFSIRVFGATIGQMEVKHSRTGDGTEVYSIVSNSKAKILWVSKIYRSVFEARYREGKFISSSHLETENGNVKRWTKVNYDGKLYQVDAYNGKRSFSEVPVYCDASYYFEDYRKVNRIFYLPDASFYNLTRTNDNTVEFKSADGHRNVYFFKDGQLKRMEFHLALATVYMDRIE